MAHKYNVLHLEDNPIYIEAFENFIKSLNVNYEAVINVVAAFDRLEKQPPHLLIVDLMLEDDSNPKPGIKFIEEVSAKYPNVRMMVLSAQDDPKYKKKLQDYVVHYENKSFRPSTLKEKMKTILEGSLEGNGA